MHKLFSFAGKMFNKYWQNLQKKTSICWQNIFCDQIICGSSVFAQTSVILYSVRAFTKKIYIPTIILVKSLPHCNLDWSDLYNRPLVLTRLVHLLLWTDQYKGSVQTVLNLNLYGPCHCRLDLKSYCTHFFTVLPSALLS